MAADRRRITSEDQLPLVLELGDWESLLNCCDRTVQRLDRAGQLPPKLIDGNHEDGKARPRWARSAVIAWLNGSSPRRGRRV